MNTKQNYIQRKKTEFNLFTNDNNLFCLYVHFVKCKNHAPLYYGNRNIDVRGMCNEN